MRMQRSERRTGCINNARGGRFCTRANFKAHANGDPYPNSHPRTGAGTDDCPTPDLTTLISQIDYSTLTCDNGQYVIKGYIRPASGDYVVVNYYPYTRDNNENYYRFRLYKIWGDTSCCFALFEVTLHEISEPNPFGLKYAISSVIRLDNADFEFEA